MTESTQKAFVSYTYSDLREYGEVVRQTLSQQDVEILSIGDIGVASEPTRQLVERLMLVVVIKIHPLLFHRYSSSIR